ncbi:MAG: histidine phosphatase family protein [Castellaniella sp.]|uniref:histidine phosphatase family protein n=1 Tax=Castellaniella sp. TaxID=1955812 RepID=UPI003A848E82
MPTTFWLVRHGETLWNTERRLQGWQDLSLNPAGVAQARQLEAWLRSPHFDAPIERIVTSDLARARQTAEIASSHWRLPIERLAMLRERHFGSYEGQPLDALRNPQGQPVGFHALDDGMEGGESLGEFRRRIQQAFEQLAQAHPAQHLLVFSHGGVIDMAWRLATGADSTVPGPRLIINTSINQFLIDTQCAWTLGQWGVCGHLEPGVGGL